MIADTSRHVALVLPLVVGAVVLAAFCYDIATDILDRVKGYDGTDGTPGSAETRVGRHA